jgi:hypothetical protein
MILTKALAPHLNDAMDSIDALKVKPDDLLPSSSSFESTTDDRQDKNLHATASTLVNSVSYKIVSDEPTHINLFIWLRIMLQQFHADQIHRNAAVRLMFETASVGALTATSSGGMSSDVGGGGYGSPKGTSNAGGSNNSGANHVEYPQFQSICTTLFPWMSITEVAFLYAKCHYSGKRRVTAEVFNYHADISGYFAHSLKLPTLPLLKQLNIQEEINSFLLNGKGSGDPSNGSGMDGMIGLHSSMSIRVDGEEGAFTKQSLFTIRSKLATTIHRHFAGVLPGIKHIMKYLPEKWKILLQDAIDNTQHSLHDSFQKLRDLNKVISIQQQQQQAAAVLAANSPANLKYPAPTGKLTSLLVLFRRNLSFSLALALSFFL